MYSNFSRKIPYYFKNFFKPSVSHQINNPSAFTFGMTIITIYNLNIMFSDCNKNNLKYYSNENNIRN